MNPLIEYWSRTFSNYRQPGAGIMRFRNPRFSDPILSANFILADSALESYDDQIESLLAQQDLPFFSLIRSLEDPALNASEKISTYTLGMQFHLGVRQLKQTPKLPSPKYKIEIQSMKSAAKTEWFWSLLKEGFPYDYPFLQKLIPELLNSKSQHYTISAEGEAGAKLGMLQLGLNQELALANNVAVAKQVRRQGVGECLINTAVEWAPTRGIEKIMFWTEHEFLREYADQNFLYQIYLQKERHQ